MAEVLSLLHLSIFVFLTVYSKSLLLCHFEEPTVTVNEMERKKGRKVGVESRIGRKENSKYS